MFGSDSVCEVNGGKIRSTYFGSFESDFQNAICKIAGFCERFFWAKNLSDKQKDDFYFDYKLKKDFKY